MNGYAIRETGHTIQEKRYPNPATLSINLRTFAPERNHSHQMSTTSENNKRIAKNSLMLYFRMFVMLLIGLYTSRVVLNALGVENYGILNAVGGVVAMFSFVSSSMSGAISRFTTFTLGTGDKEKLNHVFCTGINIMVGLGLVFVLLTETIGVWFLNTQMNIPEGRMFAANVVLQFSVFSSVVGLICAPYGAAIIAHEKMSVYAYMTILDVTLKLLVAFLLTISPIDVLIFNSILGLCVSLLMRFIYNSYSRRHFEECTYHFIIDKPLLKEMTGFAGWTFFGNTAYLFNTQGVNMLMNIYFGVTVNAARGIAVSVNSHVIQFVTNFTTALNPQITKSYARGDLDYMHGLMCRSAKFSSFLYLLLAVPIVVETPLILKLWLINPPDYASIFVQLTLLGTFLDNVLAGNMVVAMQATGHVSHYQKIVATIGAAVFFGTWIAFALGFPPQSSYVVFAVVYAILIFVRLWLMRGMVKLSTMMYVREVLYKVVPVMCLAFVLPVFIHSLMKPDVLRLVCVCLVSLPVTAALSYYLGMTANEKVFIRKEVISKITSKFKH